MQKLYEQPLLFCAIRIAGYTAILVGIWYLMLQDSVSEWSDSKFGEDSWTEYLQQTVLLITAALYFGVAYSDEKVRGFAIALSGFCTALFVREFNNFFHTIFIGAWQAVVMVILAITGYLMYRNRNSVLQPARKFLKTPAFGWIASGILIVMVFSRLYGLHGIWYNLMGEEFTDAHRWVKNASEEGVELLGYAIFFFGTLEYMIIRHRKRLKKSKSIPAHS